IEVLEVGNHHLVPQAQLLEILDQVFVGHGELARQIGLDVEVLIFRLDTGGHTNDVGDGRGRRNGNAVGVAHADFSNTVAQGFPIHGAAAIDVQVTAALFGQQVDAVVREDAAIPQRALEGGVATALFGQVGRGPVGVV